MSLPTYFGIPESIFDVSNEYSPITIVAAITSQFDEMLYPTEVLIKSPEGGMIVNSVVLLNQIRSIKL